jgi:hypothetical protein
VRRYFVCYFIFLFVSVFVSGGDIGIPPDTDLAGILNKPAMVGSAITGETAADHSRWITMDADVHVCIAVPLDDLRAVARDFENYPRVFKRMKKSTVSRTGTGVYVEMFVSVGLLGINYNTAYTLLAEERIDTPARFLLDFSYVSGDGLVQNAHGIWYFESVTVNGSPAVYTRYIAKGTVLRKYPLQETIMNMFVNLEHIDLMNQFLKAASAMKKIDVSGHV